MLWVGLMQARDDHMTQTNVESIYYCNIGAPALGIHFLNVYKISITLSHIEIVGIFTLEEGEY